MIRSLKLLILNDILLIRGEMLVVQMTEVRRRQSIRMSSEMPSLIDESYSLPFKSLSPLLGGALISIQDLFKYVPVLSAPFNHGEYRSFFS